MQEKRKYPDPSMQIVCLDETDVMTASTDPVLTDGFDDEGYFGSVQG